jgi:PEP-CTERM/exosortase A-associated glycosyltransferase
MRVLHALHTSLPYICGYSIRSDYTVRLQKRIGMDPAVVTSAQHPNGHEMEESLDGITYWRTQGQTGRQLPGGRELGLMRVLERRIEEAAALWKPDVIHAHSPMLVGLPALRVARKRGIPCVYEVRDLWENASVDRGKFKEGSLLYRVARSMETRVLRNAAAVVTICESLRNELAPRVGRPDRLFVVDNGVNAEGFSPDTMNRAGERWGLDGKKIIGYIGTFQPYEGLDTLILAMPVIQQQVPEAHLVITGSGGQEDTLRSLVEERGLGGMVTFTGRLPHDEVRSVYAMADVMAYPRILTRTTAITTPLKPLEAMAMGKPVIVSDVPAMAELVQPEKTGLTFRAGDSDHLAAQAARLLADSALRSRLGEEGRRWVLANRQWPDLVARYVDIYGAVTAQRN